MHRLQTNIDNVSYYNLTTNLIFCFFENQQIVWLENLRALWKLYWMYRKIVIFEYYCIILGRWHKMSLHRVHIAPLEGTLTIDKAIQFCFIRYTQRQKQSDDVTFSDLRNQLIKLKISKYEIYSSDLWFFVGFNIKKWRTTYSRTDALSEKLYGLGAKFVYKQIKLTYGMLQVQQLCTDLPAFYNKKFDILVILHLFWHFRV